MPREDEAGVWDDRINYLLGMWSEEKIPNSEGTPFEKRKLRGLKSRSRRTEATAWIGKEGATEALVSQIENQLKSRELVKVKIQRSALGAVETNDFAAKVAASTGSTLVETMGHTFTVYKKRTHPNVQRKVGT
ncbi:MAG TPA: YhbY family RNA-binding protein [Candidatus Dormibacteraeota bacterium]|nr:YhbY family RNA-binding protein [Candidatus Dormibacteraeota bacterium]